ncbi:MAG: hypothetical protein QXH30_01640 [Candidatus Bilamarchaeaceae archaeon]
MSSDSIRSIKGVEAAVSNQTPAKRQLNAEPLEDGAPETTRVSRLASAIRRIKEAALPALLAGAMSLSPSCLEKTFP